MARQLILTANFDLTAQPRRVTRNGKAYIVAPLTLIVSGVLEGSQGALYYPPEELGRNVEGWNGAPITLGHPTRNGRPVSAKTAGVQSLGFIEKARVSNGKLLADGYFEVDATRAADADLLEDLKAGRQVELSTGLYSDRVLAPLGSVDRKGRAYDFIARNYQADHLAVLRNEVGACSIRDGCGVNVRNGRGSGGRVDNNDDDFDPDDVLPYSAAVEEAARDRQRELEGRHQDRGGRFDQPRPWERIDDFGGDEDEDNLDDDPPQVDADDDEDDEEEESTTDYSGAGAPGLGGTDDDLDEDDDDDGDGLPPLETYR